MLRCPPAMLVLLAITSGQGFPGCKRQAKPTAVSTGGTLELLPDEYPQGWKPVEIQWKVSKEAGERKWIVTVEKNKSVSYAKGSFDGRAVLQQETLSLRISPVRKGDSGVYMIEFEDTSGVVSNLCFHVLVLDPIPQPELVTHTLHQEQGWCNISLLCSVGAESPGNLSYSWKCSGDPPEALENQPLLFQRVPEGADPTTCLCNVTNPVGWSVASAGVVVVCAPGVFSLILWPAVASAVGLTLVLIVTCCWWRKKRKHPPQGHLEEPLTIYETVGEGKTSQDPNVTSEATQGGNTIYTVVCPTTQEERRFQQQQPGSCTIYSEVQLSKRSPSLRRKRLDRALVSTAYLEDTGDLRPWRLSLHAPHPAGHNLS